MEYKKIYYNIDESDYKVTTIYFDFYFSSEFYAHKFKMNYASYIENEQNKLKVKFGQNVHFVQILLLDYYKKVEKRGFRVYDNLKKDYIKSNYKIKGCIVSD